jgi:hypothetical protein
MKLRGLVPNSNIHISVSDLNIPTIGLPILLQEKKVDRSWESINRSQIHESGNKDGGRAVSFRGIH